VLCCGEGERGKSGKLGELGELGEQGYIFPDSGARVLISFILFPGR